MSTWLPRGALALPTAALVLGLFLLPVALIWDANPGMKPARGAFTLFAWMLGAGATVVAWISFVRGRRFGRGAWSSAWRGLAVTVVLFTPAWGYSVSEARGHRYFDAESERLTVTSAYLGSGGRYLFANGTMRARGPSHAFIVDLEQGTWRRVGEPADWFAPVGSPGPAPRAVRRTRPLAVVARVEAASRDSRRAWLHFHEGGSARVVKSGWSDMRFDEVEKQRAQDPVVVDDLDPSDLRLVAVLEDRTLVGIAGNGRIVRVRPGGAREVLFPR